MIQIVTIEREFGCGAPEIAQSLAGRLHWELWDELLTREIARLTRCSPGAVGSREWKKDHVVYRILKDFLRGAFEGNLPPASHLELVDAERIAAVSERVVREAAANAPCIIVGRGSQYFLNNRQDVFRVFLYAPREEKMRRLISAGQTRNDAIEQVETIDRDRAAFIKKHFGHDWPDRSLYHVMLNTAAGDETVTRQLLVCMQELDPSVRAGLVGNSGDSSSRSDGKEP